MLGSSGLVGRSLLPVTVRLASFQSQPVDHQQEYMHKGDRHGNSNEDCGTLVACVLSREYQTLIST